MKRAYLPLAPALLAVVAVVALGVLRQGWQRLGGDEPTYLAMAASLAAEGDLTFGTPDLARLEESEVEGAGTLILQRAGDRVAYSKPALYPLLAAPLYLLLGAAALPVTNALLLAAALFLGWAWVRRSNGAEAAAWATVTFAGSGVLLCYVGWLMGDALQAALALAGLALSLGAERPLQGAGAAATPARWFDHPAAPVLGGLALGLLVSLRYPNALLALAPPLVLVLRGRWGKAARVAAATLVALALALAANLALTGAATPYRAERATFDAASGYPVAGAEEVLEQFETRRATHSLALSQRFSPAASAYSALYFVVGRHTGLLAYLPAALIFGWAALRRRDLVSWTLVAAASGLALFYLAWLPYNYFGGAAFLGNRYFLAAYPALLLAPLRPPGAKLQAAVWGIALVSFASAWLSISDARFALAESGEAGVPDSQSHATSGLFRMLPFESTASSLDGPSDRFWSSEFLRFADRRSKVREHGFELDSRRGPAELMVATPRQHGVLRFVAQANVPLAELVIDDWRRRHVVELPTGHDGAARALVELEVTPAWRRHPFKWQPGESWRAHVLRFGLRTPDGLPARAEVRYLGPYRVAPRFFSSETLELDLPATAPAGERSYHRVKLRNAGRRAWASRDDVPVHLTYRLTPLPEGPREPIVGPMTRFVEPLPHAWERDMALEVVWPRRPGRYRMVVDLLLGGTVWFETITGKPVAVREIVVEPPAGAP